MKSSLPTPLRALGALLIALSSGCDTAPSRVPRSTQTVRLATGLVSPDVAMEVVTAITVVLPPASQISAGDVWEIASNNNRVLEQTSALREDPSSGASATFYALKPGRSVLRFVLVRPGEAEAIPAAKCEVTVRVSD
jgi:hypothetical protein